jgi:hypothetical protein
MPKPTFNAGKAARALIEAALTDDAAAAAKHGIATRTLRHYRKRLESDKDFAGVYQEHAKLTLAAHLGQTEGEERVNWSKQLDETLSVLLTAMQETAVGLEPTPEALEAISKAFAVVGELHTAREVLAVGSVESDKQAYEAQGSSRDTADGFSSSVN